MLVPPKSEPVPADGGRGVALPPVPPVPPVAVLEAEAETVAEAGFVCVAVGVWVCAEEVFVGTANCVGFGVFVTVGVLVGYGVLVETTGEP